LDSFPSSFFLSFLLFFSHSFVSLNYKIDGFAGNLNALHALVKICLVVLDCIVVLVFSGLFNHDFLQPRRSGI
jgi:hypothetical protein